MVVKLCVGAWIGRDGWTRRWLVNYSAPYDACGAFLGYRTDCGGEILLATLDEAGYVLLGGIFWC